MKLSTQTISDLMERHNHHFEWCDTYGERGYTLDEDKEGILFANWNDVPSHIQHYLEKHFELEWDDEWLVSYETSKAYRRHADGYEWKPYYLLNDWTNGEVIGGDEIEEDEDLQQEYVEEFLLNDANCINLFDINLFDINLEKLGFALVEDHLENGWHPGQTDNPHEILAELQAEHPEGEFVFSGLHNSQFYSSFAVYGRNLTA